MSKKLDAILSSVPAATARESKSLPINMAHTELSSAPSTVVLSSKERIVAIVPSEVKQQIREYLAAHPKETEKTILLKALRTFGFQVPETELEDKRGRR